jgi:hypothetical protein
MKLVRSGSLQVATLAFVVSILIRPTPLVATIGFALMMLCFVITHFIWLPCVTRRTRHAGHSRDHPGHDTLRQYSAPIVSGTTRGMTTGRRGATFLSLVVSRAARSESLRAAARAAARIESRLTIESGSGGAGTVCAGGGGPKPNGIRIPPPARDRATPFAGRGPSSAPALRTRSRASRTAR